MRPGDRLICALVQQRNVGHKFEAWPLHVTVVPWFRMDLSSAQLAQELEEVYISSQAFEVKVEEETKFGYKKQKLVNLVSAPMLERIEGQTRRLLHSYKSWIVDEADKTRNFRPHITAQGDDRADEGTTFRCDRLYIVSQRGTYKQLEAEVILQP